MAKFEKMQNGKWGVRVSGDELIAVRNGQSSVAVAKRDGSTSTVALGVMVSVGRDGSLLYCLEAEARRRKGGGNDPDAELR